MDAHIIQLSQLLELSVPKLYMLSNDENINGRHRKKCYYRNYHRVILKRTREKKIRVLNVPNFLLKTVQRRILHRILYKLPVSEYAFAYVQGRSLPGNALPHVGKEVVLKLDISRFFDSIDGDAVYAVIRQLMLSESAAVLLTNLCIYQGRLPQGAPTSPYLANLVMKRFDAQVGKWCGARGISYTRYCDDMTFSGSKAAMQTEELTAYIKRKLCRIGFSLNAQKTAVIRAAQQQRVTGIVVNEKLAVPRALRRRIRQEVYYCGKFGVQDSLNRRNADTDPVSYLHSLLGRIAYARQIEPDNAELAAYFAAVSDWLRAARKPGGEPPRA